MIKRKLSGNGEIKTDRSILDSWKEISTYLDRSEKTCRKWEKELKLPVHRLEDSPKARVFAYKDEIDIWINIKLKNRDKIDRARKKKKILQKPEIIMIILVLVLLILLHLFLF
ncbi:MAG: hypothetical protein ABFR75_10405 [Acidobacteriota bacterium]